MHYSSSLLVLSAASSLLAAPLHERANYDALPGGDIDILNYALTLELLERKFYQGGLDKYSEAEFKQAGFDDEFYTNLKQIAFDEKTHVDFLAGALGDKAIPEPTFSFPDTDPSSFIALASVLEGVGVSAYLGAAAVIADKQYVPIAGSILTVEARHSSYIRAALKQTPFPKPFDTPLNFNQVYSLAAQFITSFAQGTPELPFKAFPPLTAVPNGDIIVAGESCVTFKDAFKTAKEGGLIDENATVYAVLFSGLDTYYTKVEAVGDDYVLHEVPGANFATDGQLPPSGQVYAVLSSADGITKVSDENTLSGVAVLEVSTSSM